MWTRRTCNATLSIIILLTHTRILIYYSLEFWCVFIWRRIKLQRISIWSPTCKENFLIFLNLFFVNFLVLSVNYAIFSYKNIFEMLMFKIILFLFLWIENLIEFIEFHVFGDFSIEFECETRCVRSFRNFSHR